MATTAGYELQRLKIGLAQVGGNTGGCDEGNLNLESVCTTIKQERDSEKKHLKELTSPCEHNQSVFILPSPTSNLD